MKASRQMSEFHVCHLATGYMYTYGECAWWKSNQIFRDDSAADTGHKTRGLTWKRPVSQQRQEGVHQCPQPTKEVIPLTRVPSLPPQLWDGKWAICRWCWSWITGRWSSRVGLMSFHDCWKPRIYIYINACFSNLLSAVLFTQLIICLHLTPIYISKLLHLNCSSDLLLADAVYPGHCQWTCQLEPLPLNHTS